MIRSELRATVSSGLTLPPTSTGISPNLLKSKSSFAVLGRNQLGAINTAAKARMIQGKKHFMRLCDCPPPLSRKFHEMKTKLHQQTGSDNDARNVRRNEARI